MYRTDLMLVSNQVSMSLELVIKKVLKPFCDSSLEAPIYHHRIILILPR